MREGTVIEAAGIIVLSVLGINAVWDIRKREIILPLTILFAAAGVCFRMVCGPGVIFILTGLIPGGLLALISLLSRGSAGLGDAILIAAAGIWTGGRTAALLLIIGLGIQAVVSVIYRLAGGKNTELPFVPAVCAAYGMLILMS